MDAVSRDALLQRAVRLVSRGSELSGRVQTLMSERDRLIKSVGIAKATLELGPEIEGVLETLNREEHEASVGVYEELLTALLDDVFPGKGRVSLDLIQERNAPALYLSIKGTKNGMAHEEDIEDGSGGFVTNVIVAGLRYSALARTNNRPFLVLDEPDCWTKPEHVQSFAKMIHQVSDLAGVQTLMISHNDVSQFEGLVNVHRLLQGPDGRIRVHCEDTPLSDFKDDSQPGIRYIRGINFRMHTDTVLRLYPGVNVLLGGHDIGKSTLATHTLQAVAYGMANDSLIATGADYAQVEIGLEDNKTLLWTRNRKGTPKTVYSLFQGDKLLNEARPEHRGDVPGFVIEALGVDLLEGLSVQVAQQKRPLFLINETPSVRAKLLSLGQESGRLRQLNDLWKKEKQRAQDMVRRDEPRLEALLTVLPRLEKHSDINEALTTRHGDIAAVNAAISKRAEQRDAAKKLERQLQRVALLADVVQHLKDLPDPPTLSNAAQMRKDGATLRIMQGRKALTLPAMPELPQIADTGRAARTDAAKLKRLQTFPKLVLPETPAVPAIVDRYGSRLDAAMLATLQSIAKLRLPQLPALPEVTDRAPTRMEIKVLQGARTRVQESAEALAVARRQEAEAENERAALEAELGACPLCAQPFHKETDHVHYAA